AGVLAIIIFLTAFVSVRCSKIGDKYNKEYTFQDAVSNFGLITGLRLDASRLIFKSKDSSSFEIDKKKKKKKSVETDAEPIEYGDNKMEIDFEALKANENNATVRNLHDYVSSLTPSKKNEYTGLFKDKNLIFITAEAFSAEAIDENLTPTLYRLATKGINFTDYYQPASAGTTGGEYQNILGLLPSLGGKSFKQSATHNLYFTMGNQLNRLGYYGKAFHNNSYTFYDRNKTHINLGYSDGFMGYGNGMEQYVENCWPQSDLEMLQGTLPTYIDKEKFNVYYMSVSGHNNYSQSGNKMAAKNWQFVENLSHSEPVKGYLAANIELDRALEYTLQQLEEKGKMNDTVICIGADHFPYGLDNGNQLGNMPYLAELYGFSPKNNLERDHNRLILWCGCLESKKPIVVSAPTSSLDILPTLSNLFGTEFDSRLMPGRDVFSDADPLVFNTGYDWKTDLGTYISSTATFTPASPDVQIPDGYVDGIKSIVRNKIKYCADVLNTDYFAHIFGK
ncbi:MAG: LTA synthase family protein, partial [Clostridia bacterium]|nr:LTA synthase family protein [Clostridia bacterium]